MHTYTYVLYACYVTCLQFIILRNEKVFVYCLEDIFVTLDKIYSAERSKIFQIFVPASLTIFMPS